MVEDGYEFFAKRQLVTLFSAPNYCGEFDNAGAMMSVDETLMCSFQVSPSLPAHIVAVHDAIILSLVCVALVLLLLSADSEASTGQAENLPVWGRWAGWSAQHSTQSRQWEGKEEIVS